MFRLYSGMRLFVGVVGLSFIVLLGLEGCATNPNQLESTPQPPMQHPIVPTPYMHGATTSAATMIAPLR